MLSKGMKWVVVANTVRAPRSRSSAASERSRVVLATAANRGDDGRKTAAGCGREANAATARCLQQPINLRVLLCGCYSVVQMVAALLGHFCCGHTSIALLGQRARGKPKDIKTIH